MILSPYWRGLVGWTSSCKAKGQGPTPDQLQVPSQGVYKRQPIDGSLPLFVPPFPSLYK